MKTKTTLKPKVKTQVATDSLISLIDNKVPYTENKEMVKNFILDNKELLKVLLKNL